MELSRLIWVFLTTTLGDWIGTRRLKRRLQRGLGHEVTDVEATSLKRWMEMPQDKRYRRSPRLRSAASSRNEPA